MKTIIIGAGISGLSTAFHLKKDYAILEKENTPGGLCRSVTVDGFTFDYTGHFIHLQNDYTKKFVFSILKNNIKKNKRNSWIYSHNSYTRYPFQANLYGLPKKVIKECISGLIETKFSTYPLIPKPYFLSFRDWVLSTFGKGFAKYFFFPYNEKLWTINLDCLTTEWINIFIPQPDIEEVITGAFLDQKKMYGYNAYFYYPKIGGIQSFIDSLTKKIKNIYLNSPVKKIYLKEKTLISGDKKINYAYLVSTIPLPELLSLIENLPDEIDEAKDKLLWNSVDCINIGIKQPNIQKNKHWVYFPEKKFIFYRVGFYHNFSKEIVPRNSSSMYIEVAYKPTDRPNKETILQKVFSGLQKSGIFKKNENVSVIKIFSIPYAYVIYDKNRNDAVKKIQTFLEKNNVYSIGRFGAWKYSYIEESILDGKITAEKILKNG